MSETPDPLRTAIYGLISDRVSSGAPGDWMAFEAAVNDVFDAAARPSPAEPPAGDLREALAERLPVKDTPTTSEGGGPVTLAVHFGTRANLIESIVEIAVRARKAETPEPGALDAIERQWLDATPPAGHPLIHGIFQRLPGQLAASVRSTTPPEPEDGGT